jgi:hypothetical protein
VNIGLVVVVADIEFIYQLTFLHLNYYHYNRRAANCSYFQEVICSYSLHMAMSKSGFLPAGGGGSMT